MAATADAEALLALEPDCVVHTAMADHRLMEAIEDLAGFLRRGIDVVSSGPVFLQYPYGVVPDEMFEPAEAGSSTLFVSDPGFANDTLPLALTGICERIDEIRCMEIVNYATYDHGWSTRCPPWSQRLRVCSRPPTCR